MMAYAYDSSGRFGGTPAPVVEVILEWNGRRSPVRALVDTGASVTAIPRAEYRRLGLRKIGDPEDIGGVATARADRTVVNITFEGVVFPNFPVVTTEDLPCTLIGRDILNRYVIECDGPRSVVTIR